MVRIHRWTGVTGLALIVSLATLGCLEAPAESTLAGFLDTTGSPVGEDPAGLELELVCETSREVLVSPLVFDHGHDSRWPLFEREIPAGEPTYCYFVQRSEPFDLFLGFLGLEPDRCDDPRGWDRMWLEWDGGNTWTDTVRAQELRTCPSVDLAQPAPSRTASMDHCIYCGQADVTYVLTADSEDLDADSSFVIYVCVGFREILGEEYFSLYLAWVAGFPPNLYYEFLTEWPAALSSRVERIDGGIGFSSLDFVLEEYAGDLQAEMMFHTEQGEDGVIRSLSGMVALYSAVPGYEWGIAAHTIDPLELPGGVCTEPPMEWFEFPIR